MSQSVHWGFFVCTLIPELLLSNPSSPRLRLSLAPSSYNAVTKITFPFNHCNWQATLLFKGSHIFPPVDLLTLLTLRLCRALSHPCYFSYTPKSSALSSAYFPSLQILSSSYLCSLSFTTSYYRRQISCLKKLLATFFWS